MTHFELPDSPNSLIVPPEWVHPLARHDPSRGPGNDEGSTWPGPLRSVQLRQLLVQWDSLTSLRSRSTCSSARASSRSLDQCPWGFRSVYIDVASVALPMLQRLQTSHPGRTEGEESAWSTPGEAAPRCRSASVGQRVRELHRPAAEPLPIS